MHRALAAAKYFFAIYFFYFFFFIALDLNELAVVVCTIARRFRAKIIQFDNRPIITHVRRNDLYYILRRYADVVLLSILGLNIYILPIIEIIK